MATTIFDKPLDHDVSEKLNTGNVYNGLDQESSGYALDARQGKALNQAIANLNEIGSVINGSGNSSSPSVANETATIINSIELTKGRWLIIANCDWSSNANGYRQIAFQDAKEPTRNLAVTSMTAGANKETYQQLVRVSTVQSTATVNVYGYQNSGSSLSAYPFIMAVKIAI